MKLIIIDYGVGNIKSIQFAFKRLGVNAILSNNPEEIKKADKIILPGVGEASHAMTRLNESGLNSTILNLSQPVLGICLGMQLLCKFSEEANTKGLGIFDVTVKRFSNQVKVPQVGWNTISDLKSNLFKGIKENSYMYSVHSFYAENTLQCIAKTNYDGWYSSALKNDNFYGVQFHPEKSGDAGLKLLHNFLNI